MRRYMPLLLLAAAILQAAGGCALRTADSAPPEPEEPAETMQETAEPEIPLETEYAASGRTL